MKYKTELCKNFMTNGSCKYFNKCKFAHGNGELNDKFIINNKYKSKKCEPFHQQFVCTYGTRCLYQHNEENPAKKQIPFYMADLGMQMYLKQKHRAIELTK